MHGADQATPTRVAGGRSKRARPRGSAAEAGEADRAVRLKPALGKAKAGTGDRSESSETAAASPGAEPSAPRGAERVRACTTQPPPPQGDGEGFVDPFWDRLEAEPAGRLRSAGVEDARDLASLSIATLTRILGGPPDETVVRLRQGGAEDIQKELDAPFEGSARPLFPTAAKKATPPPTAVPLRAASAAGEGPAKWRPPRQDKEPEEGDDAARTTAAEAAVAVLRSHEGSSKHAAEIAAAREVSRAEEWYRALVKVLARRYEAQGMMHPVWVWRRWLRWRRAQQVAQTDDPAAPLALNLATWLADEAAKGHTVQQSMLDGLKWLAAHLGLEGLPLRSPLLDGMATTGWKVERQAAELPREVWEHFLHLAMSAPGAIALMAKLMLYVTVVTLRFRHAQRHRFLHDRCNEHMLVGEVSRGKVRKRAAFLVAGPTRIVEGVPLFLGLYQELRKQAPMPGT